MSLPHQIFRSPKGALRTQPTSRTRRAASPTHLTRAPPRSPPPRPLYRARLFDVHDRCDSLESAGSPRPTRCCAPTCPSPHSNSNPFSNSSPNSNPNSNSSPSPNLTPAYHPSPCVCRCSTLDPLLRAYLSGPAQMPSASDHYITFHHAFDPGLAVVLLSLLLEYALGCAPRASDRLYRHVHFINANNPTASPRGSLSHCAFYHANLTARYPSLPSPLPHPSPQRVFRARTPHPMSTRAPARPLPRAGASCCARSSALWRATRLAAAAAAAPAPPARAPEAPGAGSIPVQGPARAAAEASSDRAAPCSGAAARLRGLRSPS